MAMSDSLVSVRDYLRMVFRRKWALIIPALLGILAVPAVWYSVAPKYRATALVRRKDLAILQSAPGSVVNRGDSHVSVPALRVEILTWNNLERVINQTNLDKGLETASDWQSMYSKLRDMITIDTRARGRGIDLIQIAAIHKDPELSAKITNAVADNYVERSKKISRTESQQSVQFLESGTEEYKQKLKDLEEKIREYKEKHFTDLPSVRENILDTLRSLRTQKTTEQLQLTQAKSRLEELKNQLQAVPRIVEGEVTSKENPLYEQVQQAIQQAKMDLTSLRLEYTDKHPQIQKTERRIEELKERLEDIPQRVEGEKSMVTNPEYQELKIRERELQQDIRAHKATLDQIEARIQANQQEMSRLMNEENDYNDLVRQKNEAERLYQQYRSSLVKARTRLEVESGQYGTQTEMVSRALVPTSPYQLERMKLALACVAAGLALGVGVLFGLEFTDQSFRNVEDAHEYLGIPVLGSIPTIESPEQVRERRRKKLTLAVWTSVFLIVVGGGLFLAWYMYPNEVRMRYYQVSAKLQALVSMIRQSL